MRRNWIKKISVYFLLLALGLSAASCDGEGCIGAEEFDTKYIKVESNPKSDGVFGSYDDVDGGQVATWHNTGLRTSNEEFIILVSGGWVPWKANQMTRKKFQELDECNICAKRNNVASENCICFQHKLEPDFITGQEPKPEIGASRKPVKADCDGVDQDDPELCSCTTNNGKADDYGIFHFPLNYYTKDHVRKNPDDQTEACKYTRGLGLYLGVFGKSSNETPLRAYHLFSEDEICPISRNSNGECVDEHGENRLKYVFRSKNQRIFVKDDLAGNDGLDIDSGNDIYHQGNEYIKLIVYDRYYSDNYGHYNVEFLKGVFDDDDIGLLEFLVRIVEDQLLGEKNYEGDREGGVLEFFYNSITKDSNFLLIFQVTLVLYIAFFGLSSLLGLVELNKKEIYGRIVKIGFVIFFTSPESWEFYNQIVVGFFKDGMDSVIDIITSLGEVDLDKENNPLVLAQLGSASPGSTGSRFSYVDIMLRTLFSDNVTKKIWGLFFYDVFGFMYIAIIYFAIFYFLYVMLLAATVYAVTLMKLIFVLALGPIFITFALFKYTEDIFKKWISFLAARSLEIIILFLLLYTLVGFIDQKFNELLYYDVCYSYLVNGYINIKVLKAHLDRDMITWLSMTGTVTIFIFMAQTIFEQIPSLAGALISVGGVGNSSSGVGNNASGFGLAGSIMGEAFQGGKKLAGFAVGDVGGNAFRGLRTASRMAGVSGAIDSASSAIPFRGVRSRLRDGYIKRAVNKGKKEAKRKGLKGKEFDSFVRNYALNDRQHGLLSWRHRNKKTSALMDMSSQNMLNRMDHLLVKQPLKNFLKDRAKELKSGDPSSIPLGKDMIKQLKSDARSWANDNLAGGADSINGHLHDMKKLMKDKSELSASEAAKKFGKNDDMKNRYLQHLKDKKFEKHGLKGQKAMKDSKNARKFLRKSHDNDVGLWDSITGRKSRLGSMGLASEGLALNKMSDSAENSMLRSYLMKGGIQKDRDQNQEYYDRKRKEALDQANSYGKFNGKASRDGFLEKKMGEKDGQISEKREFYKNALSNHVSDSARTDLSRASGEKERTELARKAAEDYLRMKEEHMKKIGDLAGNDNWKDLMAKNGGKDNYRDGLIDMNGSSLFEARTRAQIMAQELDNSGQLGLIGGSQGAALHGLIAQDSSLGNEGYGDALRSAEEVNSAFEELNQIVSEADAKAKDDSMPSQADLDALEERYNNATGNLENILPTEPDIEFGASIMDALGPMESDIGLKAGNVGIGAQTEGIEVDHVLLANCQFERNSSELKVKTAKYQKAMAELKLANLKNENPSDPEIRTLENEVADFKHEIRSEENRISSLDSQMSVIKNSTIK